MPFNPYPLGMVKPRKATPRNFGRPTYGPHVALINARLGRPLIPWQKFVADVTGEIDEDGYLYYNKVILTGPRQIGKTVFDLGRNVQNCLIGPHRRAWYTAQSGQHASAKWREMTDGFIEAPGLKNLAKRRLTNGSEVLKFRNGSEFRPHPPTEDSLHSKQSDTNTIDEAWAFTELQGIQLLGAIQPTTGTRRMLMKQQPQLWIMSTEGTVESTFFNPELDAARAGAIDERTAFFDFGIPDDADPNDLETIARWHPGFGHIFDMESLIAAREQLKQSPGEFARAYGNRRTGATERVLPAGPWRDAAWLESIEPGPVCFGAATGVDGVDTTIVAAQRVTTPYGPAVVVAVVEHQPGTWWALDRLRELSEKFGAPAAIDRVGPSSSLHDEATRAGLNLVELDSAKITAACQRVLAGITNPNGATIRHKPHPAFDAAAELATRRWISDGAWVWGRRASVGSISALEALTLAAWGLDHMPSVRGFQLG